jgi:formate hydrogenlyase transcriptional activator
LRREDARGPLSPFDSPLGAGDGPLDSTRAPPSAAAGSDRTEPVLTLAELRALEHDNFVRALTQSGFQIAGPGGAARRLGMSPSTLSYRLKQLGIEKPR